MKKIASIWLLRLRPPLCPHRLIVPCRHLVVVHRHHHRTPPPPSNAPTHHHHQGGRRSAGQINLGTVALLPPAPSPPPPTHAPLPAPPPSLWLAFLTIDSYWIICISMGCYWLVLISIVPKIIENMSEKGANLCLIYELDQRLSFSEEDPLQSHLDYLLFHTSEMNTLPP